MYLIDTNVISEARKGRKANPGVIHFFRSIPSNERYLSAQTIGEIRRGIENVRRRGDQDHAVRLETWLDLVIAEYSNRILGFDTDSAQVWGRLMSPQASHPVDKQIAAIAILHGLDVATRNVSDFSGFGLQVLNPFK
ncbi:MAG: type II toxin-antitoxin system VapC family toxin [Pseudomonadota bacterium]